MAGRTLPFALLFSLACGSSSSSDPAPGGDGSDPGDGAADGSTSDGSGDGTTGDGDGGSAQDDAGLGAPCNGDVALCDRPFDQVVFPATHNAHSAQEYGYPALNANQISGLAKQLDDGIRAMLLDVYEDAGEHVFCHGSCLLAKTSHVEGLTTLHDFLVAHPREVFTIIYEDHLDAALIADDLVSTGLDALAYTHQPGTPWPTLGEMIAADTRLVVTLETGGPPPAWLHHVWDEAWDTPYTFKAASEFRCDLNRGAQENALFLVNHWLGTAVLGTPSEDGAKMVNTYDVLYGRAKGCWDETGDVPNIVAVDFYEHGDLFEVVRALNGL